jgi:molybdopterin synthase catalytic subunit
MKVRVLFFSVLRDVARREEMEVEIAEGENLGQMLERLSAELPGLRAWEGKLLLAVDEDYATQDTVLREGQEVAVMPPVQGG